MTPTRLSMLIASPLFLSLAACSGQKYEDEGTFAGDCTDGADNDDDGLFDCDDDGCAGSPACAGPDENAAPSGAAIAIEPAAPTDADDLTCTIVTEATDPNGDAVTYRYGWTVNGADAGISGATVGAALTSGGDTWTCTVTPNDGALDGAPTSASVTIARGNQAPSAPGVSITPASPTDDDVLTCVIGTESVDPDGDAVTYSYAWSVDGADAGITAASVNGSRTSAGETWTCSVTANDGELSSAPGTASVEVGAITLGSDPGHPGASCKDILDNGGATGDGAYWVDLGTPTKVYCDMSTKGGGWTLVRRNVDAGWNDNPDDNLRGDAAYGATSTMTPTSVASFGIAFSSLDFTQFRFATGDEQRWLIVDSSEVYDGWAAGAGVCGEEVVITSSHISATSYRIDWCKRTGAAEDPWISATDHNAAIGGGYLADTDDHSMLYGESTGSAYIWGYFVSARDGANVWVR